MEDDFHKIDEIGEQLKKLKRTLRSNKMAVAEEDAEKFTDCNSEESEVKPLNFLLNNMNVINHERSVLVDAPTKPQLISDLTRLYPHFSWPKSSN